MTVWGWDLSHYDGTITAAEAKAAYAAGIRFTTHKISEGAGGADTTAAAALTACRDAGIKALGGYLVVRSGAVQPQIDEMLTLLDESAAWWRTWPGWFWQVDLERWAYDDVPVSTGIAAANALRAQTNRLVLLYASAGQYGDQLKAWPGPLWNAHYGSNPAGTPAKIYPGDSSAGWTSYSGKQPTMLQFGSRATIGTMTTCDVDAYRGTEDQLLALIGGDMTSMAKQVLGTDPAPGTADSDCIDNNSPHVKDSPQYAGTPKGTNTKTSAGYAIGRTRYLAEDIAVNVTTMKATLDKLVAAATTPAAPPAAGVVVQLDPSTVTALAAALADELATRLQS